MFQQLLTVILISCSTYAGISSQITKKQNPAEEESLVDFFFVITGIRTNNVIRYLLNFIVVVGISSALTYLLAPELLSDSGKSFEEIAKLKLAFLSASITLIIITGQSTIKLH